MQERDSHLAQSLSRAASILRRVFLPPRKKYTLILVSLHLRIKKHQKIWQLHPSHHPLFPCDLRAALPDLRPVALQGSGLPLEGGRRPCCEGVHLQWESVGRTELHPQQQWHGTTQAVATNHQALVVACLNGLRGKKDKKWGWVWRSVFWWLVVLFLMVG